ncbi:cation-transporting P-type ATPase [Erwinia tracheiphila]|uniref:Uncharacterized protein n=1 Tax=Erwinia tracheiphila TaxID=65700 RepID=A0A345CV45_9GAMM|nr:hypothetical protein AV903_16755 [Erwinia tracheiphila]
MLKKLNSTPARISTAEAQERLTTHGANQVAAGRSKKRVSMLSGSF